MDFTILLIIVVVAALFIILLYNKLVALRQTRKNAFSDIDVQLRQRFDLIPQLVETVKGYMKHEQEILENVTAARAGVDQAGDGLDSGRVKAESALSGAMMNLFAVAENYPDLKADANYRQLMAELSDIENKIAAARRFFNNATSEYNTAVQQFPANLIAGSFGFKTEEFFEVDEATNKAMQDAPEIKLT